MLMTGNHLKAARALAGLSQGDLAKASKIHLNTISKMEKRGAETLTSGLDTIRALMTALDAAGVEVMNHGQPGVRLKSQAEKALAKRRGK